MPNWKKVITSGSDASLNTLSVSDNTHLSGSLNVFKSGSAVFTIEGSQGTLFQITDQLSGSLFSVADISGVPSFEVFSDDTVKIGTFGSEAVIVEGDVLKLSQLSNQSSEATAVVINGSNVVGTRELGSNAFNSTTIPTNNNQLTNGAGYITDGNTNWNNSYGFITGLDWTEIGGAQSNINISGFNNDSGFTTNIGDITGVTAGTNLTGGGTSGTVTINMATGGAGEGTYGSTANGTKIDTITIDAYGRVTGVATGATGTSSTSGTVTSVATGTGLTGGTITSTGTISLSHLGFQNLTDPNDDRIAFWDDSAGAFAWLDAGSNITISGTTISATNTNTTYSAGSLLDLSGTTFNVDLSELTDMTETFVKTSDEFVVLDSGVQKRKLASEIFGDNAYNSTTIPTNNNQLTNGAGYITDGNTNWNNSYGFITATSTDTLTNKSGNISMFTNDSGYITDGNTGWNNSYGFITGVDWGDIGGDQADINISGFTNDVGFTTNTGTLTSLTINTSAGLDGGGTYTTTGTTTISLDLSELTDMTTAIDTSVDEIILLDNGAERRKRFSEIFGSNAYNSTTIPTNNNQLTNGAGYTTNVGDITGVTVTAGNGLTGGGSATSGNFSKTLNVGAGTGVTVNADSIEIGQAVGTSDDVEFNNLTLAGDLTVNGTTTTINTTNTEISDNLIELNSGVTSNANDSGIIIERGTTGNNALFIWDESGDKFAVGTTTATAGSTGNISYTLTDLAASTFIGDLEGVANSAYNWEDARTITLGGDLSGNVSIDGSSDVTLTATVSNNSHTHTLSNISDVTATATEVNYVDGVTSNIQTQLNSKAEGDDFDADGTFASLRAQGTTKGDVGLGNVENTALSTYTGNGGALDNQYITNGAGYITSFTNTVDMGDGFKVQDDDGTTVTITENKYIKFYGGAGIDVDFTDTTPGSSADPFDLRITNTITNNNQLTNGAGYITDGNSGWNNSYGFITGVDWTEISGDQSNINISGFTNDSGFTTNTGTLTSLTINTSAGLDGGGTYTTTGTATISLDLSELTDMTTAIDTAVDEIILLDNGAERRKRFSEIFGSNAYNSTTIPTNNNQLTNGAGYITDGNSGWNNSYGFITGVDWGDIGGDQTDINISGFTNDAGFTSNVGDITAVTAGGGLSGGGTSGGVTVSHADTSTQSSVNNSGRTYIQDITLDNYGHITGITSATETVVNTDTNTTYSAGSLLDLSGTTFNVDLSELTDMTQAWVNSTDEFVVLDSGVQKRKLGSEIFGSNAFNSTTIPTNNNQLTNGAGYITDGNTNWNNSYGFITGIAWPDISGDANDINLSQFTNDLVVSAFTNDAGYTTNVGDITGVTAGTGLSGGGSSGGVTLNVDLSELTDMTAGMVSTDEFIVLDNGADRRKAANEIGLSIFSNDSGFVATGDNPTFGGITGDYVVVDVVAVGDVNALTPGGTATNPAIVFANTAQTSNNGIYSANSSTINISTAGTQRATFNGNGLKVNNGALGVNVNASTTDGRIDAGNDIVAYSSSDRRWKENIKPIDNALNKILKIGGYEFDWKELSEEERKTQHGNEGHDIGVIAQEVEEVLPEVVTTRENGFKGVKYDKMVALLIEGMKEQQSQIEELKSEISKLKGDG